jgi:hypothetical protein
MQQVDTIFRFGEQIRELSQEVIVVNARELRAISHCDRKSD